MAMAAMANVRAFHGTKTPTVLPPQQLAPAASPNMWFATHKTHLWFATCNILQHQLLLQANKKEKTRQIYQKPTSACCLPSSRTLDGEGGSGGAGETGEPRAQELSHPSILFLKSCFNFSYFSVIPTQLARI